MMNFTKIFSTSEKHLNAYAQIRKKCYCVTLSKQEGRAIRQPANAQYMTSPAGGNTGFFYLDIWREWSAPTGLAHCRMY